MFASQLSAYIYHYEKQISESRKKKKKLVSLVLKAFIFNNIPIWIKKWFLLEFLE